MNNDQPYLRGSKNDHYNKEDSHEYWIYEVHRCHKDLHKKGEPECAEESAIDNWLKTKRIMINYIDNKIDFTSSN